MGLGGVSVLMVVLKKAYLRLSVCMGAPYSLNILLIGTIIFLYNKQNSVTMF